MLLAYPKRWTKTTEPSCRFATVVTRKIISFISWVFLARLSMMSSIGTLLKHGKSGFSLLTRGFSSPRIYGETSIFSLLAGERYSGHFGFTMENQPWIRGASLISLMALFLAIATISSRRWLNDSFRRPASSFNRLSIFRTKYRSVLAARRLTF